MYGTRISAFACSALALALVASPATGQDADCSVADRGISVPGWMGKIDVRAAASGQDIEDSKLSMDGEVLHVMTGPAVTYWNAANSVSDDYMIKATFHEPQYMNLNGHPHPYGIIFGGNDLGTDSQSYLYRSAYGNGSFIVRGFGPDPFQMNGTVVASYDRSEIVTTGKLKSTDGMYGIRFAHNTEATVSGLTVTR